MLIDTSAEVEALAAQIPPAPGPEDVTANLRFREKIIALGDANPQFAKAVNLKCSRDPVFWMNTFAWTKNPKDFPKDPVRPVVLFPNQEGYVWWLHEHVEVGKPGLLRKSREQLASVATSNYALWRLIYRENASCLVGSYKKDVVEGVSYAKSILPKIDFTIKEMPDWALPDGWVRKKPGPCRKDMAIINPASGIAIEGETCNDDFARGGRFAWVWVDEIAHVQKQEDIHTAVGNATNCFIYTTTPRGLEMFARMVEAKDHDVYTLHWTSNYLWHPEGHSPEECQWDFDHPERSIWPEAYICAVGCKVHPNGGMPHSERYDNECKKYNYDPVRIAQELDINPQKAGSAVFDQDKISAAIKWLSENKQEFRYYKLDFEIVDPRPIRPDADYDLQWYKQARTWGVKARVSEGGGTLKVWNEPFTCRDKGCVCGGTGLHTYVAGGDTCQNVDADYHCMYIWDATAGQCVAEWHGYGEHKMVALEWTKLCKWYGGATKPGWPHAYVFVECNTDTVVLETMDRMGLWVALNTSEASVKKKKTPRLGIFADKWNKPYIIKECLQPEISTPAAEGSLLPRLFVPFMDFWKEARTYVYKYSDKTDMRPESAKMGAQTRKDHDDRVMAMAYAIYGAKTKLGMVRGFIAKTSMAKHLQWREMQGRRPTFANS